MYRSTPERQTERHVFSQSTDLRKGKETLVIILLDGSIVCSKGLKCTGIIVLIVTA